MYNQLSGKIAKICTEQCYPICVFWGPLSLQKLVCKERRRSTIKAKQNKAKEPCSDDNWPRAEEANLKCSVPALSVNCSRSWLAKNLRLLLQPGLRKIPSASLFLVTTLQCLHYPPKTESALRTRTVFYSSLFSPWTQWGSQSLKQK